MSLNTSRYAAIDIGSNAVRLLIMDVHKSEHEMHFKKVSLTRVPVRLGEDAFVSGAISERNEIRLIETMKAFYHLIKVHEVKNYRACATSAMRNSKNGAELIQTVSTETNLSIEVIDGKEEASLIFLTHVEDLIDPKKNYLYIDVGGGSTELTLFSNGKAQDSYSFKIGTIRLLNRLVDEEEWINLKSWIKENCKNLDELTAIGSGGNINRLYKMAGKSNWKTIAYDEIKSLNKMISSYSYEERLTQLNLNRDRADVIVPASQIFLTVLKWAKIKEVIVPKMGLSDGLVRQMAAND